MGKRNKNQSKLRDKEETKSSIRKDIALVLLSVIATSILSVMTTLYVARYQQPSIVVERAFYVAGVKPGKSLPGISKINIKNDNLTTIHNLMIPISKDAYSKDPTIVVDIFTKYSIEDNPYYALVNIVSLPPKKHCVITVFGIYNDLVSNEIAKNSEIHGDKATAILDATVINLPFLGSISAEEGITIKFGVVDMKNVLEQELKDGFVVNRFLGFSIAEANDLENPPETFDVKLKESTYDANRPKTFINDKEFIPGFNSVLVVLGARNEKGNRVSYVNGFDWLELDARGKKGRLHALYHDLMHFYYPGYHSNLSVSVLIEGEADAHRLILSSDGPPIKTD